MTRLLAVIVVMAIIATVAYRFLSYSATASDAAVSAVDPAEALASLEQRTLDAPDDAQAWQALGAAYVARGLQISEPEFFTRAEVALDRADRLAPNDPSTHVVRASLAVTRHQFAEAEAFAVSALVALPFNSEALAARVDAQVEQGKYAEALVSAQEFADRRPGGAALARVSYLRQLHGDVDGALAALVEAEVAVSSASVYQRATIAAIQGDVHLRTGRLDAAETSYRRALDADSEHVVATAGLTTISAVVDERSVAIANLEDAVGRSATFTTVNLLLALYDENGDDEGVGRMTRLYSELIEAERQAGAVVDLEAAVFEADHGDPIEAVALARTAYLAQPNIYAADALALALYRNGEPDAALGFSEEARRLGTSDAQFFAHASLIQAALGHQDDAKDLLDQARQINPWFSVAAQPEMRNLARRLGVDWPLERPARP